METPKTVAKPWYKVWWKVVLAALLFFVSIPAIAIYGIWQKTKWGVVGKLLASFAVIFVFVSFLSTLSSKPTPTQFANTSSPEDVSSDVRQYKVVHTLPNKRYDGGVSYYLIIEPVDLTKSFKDDIRAIVTDMVRKNGGKISIEIHDDPASLDISYRQYGSGSLERLTTKEEDAVKTRHYIASYDGELETMGENTLMFFPATFTDDPIVGEYVEFVTFNPGEQSRCEDVPAGVASRIAAGLKDEKGTSLRNLKAVKPQDSEEWIFISGDLEGAGLYGKTQIATFATNTLDNSGLTLSVDAVATEFSNWPKGSTTDFNVTMADDGAEESVGCVEESFK